MSEQNESEVDVYPVGLLDDIKRKRVWVGLRKYLWSYCIRGRRWRAARSYFNGYLAEHRHGWEAHLAEAQAAALIEAGLVVEGVEQEYGVRRLLGPTQGTVAGGMSLRDAEYIAVGWRGEPVVRHVGPWVPVDAPASTEGGES